MSRFDGYSIVPWLRRIAWIFVFAACAQADPVPIASPDAAVHADAAPFVTLDAGHPANDAMSTPVDSGFDDAGALDGGPEPCGGMDCGANAMCDIEHDVCICNEGFMGTPATGCLPIDTPLGWVGSPCNSHADCDYTDGVCQLTASGYPSGHCSLACDRVCPDRDGFAVTFCIDPEGTSVGPSGSCFARCDTTLFPSNAGCRPGYRCTPRERNTEAAVVRNVCVPDSWGAERPCADPTNHAGDDNCYLDLISYGDAAQLALATVLLRGSATADEAERWLDLNHTASQAFITDELGRTIHDNFSAGHRASQPMRGMIVHYTAAQREDGTIRYFVGSDPHASTHFVVGSERNGLIVQIFSHRNRTWHAGSTYNVDRFGFDFANAGYLEPRAGGGWEDYAGRAYSIDLPLHGTNAIEITDGIPGAASKYARKDYWQPYTYYQLLSFVVVGRALHLVYGLSADDIERHGDVASSRVDPGPALPLTNLEALIFSTDDVFSLSWLNEYKAEADWIARHPEAR